MNLKNVKKMLYVLTLFLLLLAFSCESFAANPLMSQETTSLELVENNTCTINVGTLAKLERKITRFSKEERSITVTLTVSNIKTVEQVQKPLEVFLVIDNSSSMVSNSINGITRKQAVIHSANTLVDKLFAATSNAKIGVVSFSSLDSTKGETEGTLNDAQLVLGLNNSKTDIQSAIKSIETTTAGPRTNIEAGITIASQNYSSNENTNRYMIVLTDGVPNNDIAGCFGTYIGDVATRTKTKLEQIEASGITVIGTMIGLNGETIETQSHKTYKALAEEVFGTIENSTISSYYYIQDSEIETTIVEKIYHSILTTINYTLKNITIKDYLTQTIVDNFNFTYDTLPNIGTVSDTLDTSDNSITWNIDELKEGEVATLSYKLTLKDNYDKNIVDKDLPINTNIKIDGIYNDTKLEENSDETSKVKVLYTKPTQPEQPTEPNTPAEPEKPEKPQTPTIKPIEPDDNTVATTIIPQTGDSSFILLGTIVVISIITTIRFVYMKKIKNI